MPTLGAETTDQSIQLVQLKITTPYDLGGLVETHTRLMAIATALDAIHARSTGLGSTEMFTKSARDIKSHIDEIQKQAKNWTKGGTPISYDDLVKGGVVPDAYAIKSAMAKVRSDMAAEYAKIRADKASALTALGESQSKKTQAARQEVSREYDSKLRQQRYRMSEVTPTGFSSAGPASKHLEDYFAKGAQQQKDMWAKMPNIFGAAAEKTVAPFKYFVENKAGGYDPSFAIPMKTASGISGHTQGSRAATEAAGYTPGPVPSATSKNTFERSFADAEKGITKMAAAEAAAAAAASGAIKPEQVLAHLGPGLIHLLIPADRIVATVSGNVGGPGAPPPPGGRTPTGPPSGPGGGVPPADRNLGGSGIILEETTTSFRDAEKSRKLVQKQLLQTGKTAKAFFEEVEGEFEKTPFKTVTTTSEVEPALRRARAALSREKLNFTNGLTDINQALGRGAISPSQATQQIIELKQQIGKKLSDIVQGPEREILRRLGQTGFVERVEGQAASQKLGASQMSRNLLGRNQGEQLSELRADAAKASASLTGQALAQSKRMTAQFAEAFAATPNLSPELRLGGQKLAAQLTKQAQTIEENIAAAMDQSAREAAKATFTSRKTLGKSAAQAAADLERDQAAAAKELSAIQREQAARARGTAAASARAALPGEGFSPVMHVVEPGVTPSGQQSQKVTTTFEQDAGQFRLTQKVMTQELRNQAGAWEAVEGKVTPVTRALRATSDVSKVVGRDFLQNTANVTKWAASVGLLYGSLGILKTGMSAVIEIGGQTARLGQVFRGIGGDAAELTDDVLSLAAANGRSSKEASEAAIAWSRMGLSRAEVNEAVRVSLVAANVAEISAGEATQKLSAIMLTYGLHVGQLAPLLGMLNSVSNTYRTTNADMLTGLTKTASVAHEAGIPLAELIGLLGAAIGQSGNTGSAIGTAIKSLVVSLGNPQLQKALRDQFHFEVTTAGGSDLKDMSEILREMYLAYINLSHAEKESFLFQVAGKTQANRLGAILNSYIQAQGLAINAQLNLNSAEAENTKIKATLKAQMAGLVTEFERFAAAQGGHGPSQIFTELAEGMRNVLRLSNTNPITKWLTTVSLGIAIALAAKMALVGSAMAEASGKGNFATRSLMGLQAAYAGLGRVLQQVNTQFVEASRSQGILARGTGVMVGALDASGRKQMARGAAQRGAARQGIGIQNRSASMLSAESLQSMAFGDIVPGLRMATLTAVPDKGLFGSAMQSAAGAYNSVIGQTKQILAGVLATIYSFWPAVAIFAVITTAVWAFNKAMEFVGVNSEKANAAIAGFNENAEKFSAKAAAAASASKLFETAGKALRGGGLAGEARVGLLDQVADIAEPEDAKKNAALKAELAGLDERKDTIGLTAKLEQLSAAQSIQRQAALFEKWKQNTDAVKRFAVELDRLKKADANWGWVPFLGKNIKDNIREQEKKKYQAQETANTTLDEQEQDFEKQAMSSDKFRGALERVKVAMDIIKSTYAEIGSAAEDPVDKANLEIAALDAQLELLKRKKEAMTATHKQDADAAGGATADLAAMEKEYDVLMQKVAAAKAFAQTPAGRAPVVPGFLIPGVVDTIGDKAVADAQKAAEDNRNAQVGLRKTLTPKEVFYREGMKHYTGEEDKLKAEKEAREATLAMEARRRDLNVMQRRARSEFQPYDVGETEAQKLLNMKEGLEAERARTEPLTKSADPNIAEFARVRLLETQLALNKNMFDLDAMRPALQQKLLQLEIDKNAEMRKAMLLSGPTDMLRKMAAFTLTQGGKRAPSVGEFMAFSPETRKDIQGFGFFDDDMARVRRDISTVGPQRPIGEFQKEAKQYEGSNKDLFNSFGKAFMPDSVIDPVLKEAWTQSLSQMGAAMDVATQKVAAFGDSLGDLMATDSPPSAPKRAVKSRHEQMVASGILIS